MTDTPQPPSAPAQPQPPSAPAQPQPPSAPAQPSQPRAGTADPRANVRRLVKLLKNDKRTDALSDVASLTTKQVEQLEPALLDELSKDEITKHGYELRRIIRFVQAKAAKSLQDENGTKFLMGTGHQRETKLPDGGVVKLVSDVKITAQAADNGYAITFEGPANNTHWLQFIWRRIVAVHSPSGSKSREIPVQMRINRAGRVYLLTSDRNNPRWTTDGAHKDRPFYEEDTTVERTSNALTLADTPSSMGQQVAPLFTMDPTLEKCVSTFHAAAYLIKDLEVLYRADIEMVWTIKKQRIGPAGWIASGRVANQLDAGHRAALALQFPKFDYLPGPLIEPPVPRDQFEPLWLQDPLLTGWDPNRLPRTATRVRRRSPGRT